MKVLSVLHNHSLLADRYANISVVYKRQEKLGFVLSFSAKALAIFAQSVPPAHSKILNRQNNIRRLKEMLS
jgi:hypothetical protein